MSRGCRVRYTARWHVLGLASALLLAACTGSEPGTTTIATSSNSPPGGGRLVTLDGGGNIVALNPDGSDRIRITDDAGPTVRYFQPVWSPDSSSIAWGQARLSGFAVGIADGDGDNRREIAVPAFPFYLYWAPGGDRIGVLHNGAAGALDFEVVDVGDLSAEVVDTGAPFYFSWSPGGNQVVVHADGDRLSTIDDSGSISRVAATRPGYLAPWWSPGGILHLGPDGLTVEMPDGEPRVLVAADGFVSFVADPTGSRVALQVLAREPSGLTVGLQALAEARQNVVSVLSLESGELEVVSDGASLGTFWSPDGAKLLMLLPSGNEGDVSVAVWEHGETRVLGAVKLPASLILEVLQFNDQYAQSWRIWAPDSEAFALPGIIEGQSGVRVFSLDSTEPALVTDGEWVAWSHR
jgi:TolB protein